MKFVDHAKVYLKAGNGGPGASHFRREKFVPFGGPDGGNGGNGGDIIIKATINKHTLLDVKLNQRYKADNGSAGDKRLKDGKDGNNIVIEVPIGTEILTEEDGLIIDLNEDGKEYIIVKGGIGGKGNAFFKNPTNRAPEKFQPGMPGTEGEFIFNLKVIADIGIIGLPNAGKSTLISVISKAKPKIADYPFTTLTPNLGVVKYFQKSFVVADIPGLIEGAADGKGLGDKFLKHVSRTKGLLHLIDITINDFDQIIKNYNIIRNELNKSSKEIAKKDELIAFSKIDSINEEDSLNLIPKLEDYFKNENKKVFFISSATQVNIEDLTTELGKKVFKG